MADAESDRLVLIKRGLAEVAQMIDGLPASRAKDLRGRLTTLRDAIDVWNDVPPTRIQRAAMVNSVLELNLDVLKLRRESK